jgi:preprotein translocase subunit Sec63
LSVLLNNLATVSYAGCFQNTKVNFNIKQHSIPIAHPSQVSQPSSIQEIQIKNVSIILIHDMNNILISLNNLPSAKSRDTLSLHANTQEYDQCPPLTLLTGDEGLGNTCGSET